MKTVHLVLFFLVAFSGTHCQNTKNTNPIYSNFIKKFTNRTLPMYYGFGVYNGTTKSPESLHLGGIKPNKIDSVQVRNYICKTVNECFEFECDEIYKEVIYNAIAKYQIHKGIESLVYEDTKCGLKFGHKYYLVNYDQYGNEVSRLLFARIGYSGVNIYTNILEDGTIEQLYLYNKELPDNKINDKKYNKIEYKLGGVAIYKVGISGQINIIKPLSVKKLLIEHMENENNEAFYHKILETSEYDNRLER